MTRFIPAAALLILLVIFVFWLGSHLGKDVDRMTEHLEAAEGNVRLGDWAQTYDSLKELDEVWKHAQPLYRITLEQKIIDEADRYIGRLRAAAQNKDEKNFALETSSMRSFLQGLKRAEKIAWDTVL